MFTKNCLLSSFNFFRQYSINKKVLLRERKRHTARRVVSTPSVVLPYPTRRYPPGGVPDPGTPPGGYLTWVPPWGVPDLGTPPGEDLTWVPPPGGTWPGYPPRGVPDPGTPPGGYLTWVPRGVPDLGTPPGGYLTRVPPGGVPDLGTPPGGYPTRVPPRGGPDPGTPLRGGTWPGYPPRGGVWVPPPLPHGILGNVAKHYGIWVPPLWTDRLMDGQTRVKTLPSLVLRTRAVKMLVRDIRNWTVVLESTFQLRVYSRFKLCYIILCFNIIFSWLASCYGINPANVTVQYDRDPDRFGTFPFGTIASASCTQGYQLYGVNRVPCDFTWTYPISQFRCIPSEQSEFGSLFSFY